MKTLIAIAALLILPGTAAAQSSADEKGVRAAVEQYFKGHATGSADEMRKAFLPTARIDAVRDGQLLSRTVDEFVAGFNGQPAALHDIDSVNAQGGKLWIELSPDKTRCKAAERQVGSAVGACCGVGSDSADEKESPGCSCGTAQKEEANVACCA